MSLEDWLIKENVVNSYVELLAWCRSVGVLAPSEEEWNELRPTAKPIEEAKAISIVVQQRRRRDTSGPSSTKADPDPSN